MAGPDPLCLVPASTAGLLERGCCCRVQGQLLYRDMRGEVDLLVVPPGCCFGQLEGPGRNQG